MLFIENKTLSHPVSNRKRIQILKRLQEREFIPVIRSSRLTAFELLSDSALAYDMETEIGLGDRKDEPPYVRGDLFCRPDHVFFIVFDDDAQPASIRVGIIYHSKTSEPFRKLDSFCGDVLDVLTAIRVPDEEDASALPEWQHGSANMPSGFKAFVSRQDSDSLFTSLRHKTMGDRIRAAAVLEDTSARIFLRRAKEAHVEGYAAKLLTGDILGPFEGSIEQLTEAGLVEREVQVSCRKTGHALFRLPNAHALAVVTVSDATCSECGSPVADERVDEVIAPTRLAASLLEDGSWLISRLHQLLRELGIPESEIAVGPSAGDGYGQMMANVCGESFLLLARDGDLTPAFARWAVDLEMDTEASHLVIVATGRVHKHAGTLLQNHARHRVRSGQDFELVVADDAASASAELRYAFERVTQRVLTEQLCDLDSAIGLNVSQLILAKFKLQDRFTGSYAPTDQSHLKKPLSLAAHASAGAVEVLPSESFETQPRGQNAEVEGNGNGAHLENTLTAESQPDQ